MSRQLAANVFLSYSFQFVKNFILNFFVILWFGRKIEANRARKQPIFVLLLSSLAEFSKQQVC